MDKNYKTRVDTQWIRDTSWFKKYNMEYAALDQNETNSVRKDKVKVMQKLTNYGFSIDAIKESLECKKLNHINASYKLISFE